MLDSTLVMLGLAALVAGLMARAGKRIALPTIPAFMLAGILLGPSALGILDDPHQLELIAEIGLIALLFYLGVEFPLNQIAGSGRNILRSAVAYIALNVGAGLALGFALDWGTPEALVIAGAVGISSSAIVTKLLVELRRLTNAETPVILGIIVVEDIFLAFYLALLAPFLGDAATAGEVALDFAISFGFITGMLLLTRYGARTFNALLGTEDDELLSIIVLGVAVLFAGVADYIGVSEAIGALMIGLIVSRTVLRERVERLILPLRDSFGAIFFVVFGASIALGDLGDVMVPVAIAVVLSVAANSLGGLVLAWVNGLNARSATNAALVLLGRGEFSLILATLAIAAGLDGRVAPFIALYVLILALVGPILAAQSGYLSRAVPSRLIGGYDHVAHETIVTGCEHMDVVPASPLSDGCEICRALGDNWVELRLCLECGFVGCCDDSENKHATAHFNEAGHPAITSFEPGATWRYCYVDEVLATGLGDTPEPAVNTSPTRPIDPGATESGSSPDK